MYVIEKCVEIDCGHRVTTHGSKCRNLHGHRYKVIAEVEADTVVPDSAGQSDSGMVMDFGDLKQVLMDEVHDPFDHKLILWRSDPLLVLREEGTLRSILEACGIGEGLVTTHCIPTAENLAELWFYRVQDALDAIGFRGTLVSIKVWETPNSLATFTVS